MKKLLLDRVLYLCLLGILSIGTTMAQITVSGSVTDDLGEGLVGVSVLLKGTTIGTITDLDGSFSIDIPDNTGTLELSYLGYQTQSLDVSADDNFFEVTMEQDANQLDEIVVTGLASSIKRSNLANAVSTISSDQLTGVTPQQTVDGALYGKLPGVNIVQSNGAPGGGIAMRLRGVSSLSGNNQPLWIIDGIYMSNAEIPSGARFASGANSGTEEGASNRIADLNPDDIESIEVLKGASAAAIYGTRANAGVVIVTTKKGTSGKTKISLNQDFGFNTIQNKVGRRSYTAQEVEDRFGADERAKFEAAQAAGEIFDYEDLIYGEQGFITDTKLKITGGNDKTSFFLSGGLRDEDGIIKNTGFNRKSIRLNVNHALSDNLDIRINTNYVNSSANRSFTGNENEGGLSYGYTLAFTRDWVNLNPDENGIYPNNPNYAGNPLFVRDQTRNEEETDRFIAGGSINWKIFSTDNQVLKLTLNGGTDFFLNETNVYVPETHQSQAGLDNGFIGVGKNSFRNSNYNAFLNHSYYTPGNLSFATSAGITYLNFSRNFLYNQTTQLIPLQNNLSQGGVQEISERDEFEEEFGFVLQEAINYDDKIIGTVGVRLDKSSLNGDPNKFYAFPKASLALNLANFDFWSSELFNQFKVRVAYGQTGSSADFGSLFTSLAAVNIDGQSGFVVNPQQGNPNLEPERSSEIEFGLDMGLLNNRLSIEATYYVRNVTDLLYNRALPTSSGFANEIRNDLDLRNSGLELGVNLSAVNSSKLQWNTGVNFWFNNSEITRLGVPSFVPPGVAFGLGLGTFYIDEGSPITSLWNNGDEGPEITGDTEPDFQLSWFNSLKVNNNLTFNMLMHWKKGGDVLNLSRLLTNIGGTTPAEFDDLEGFIEDASYLRLREVGLNYNLPVDIPGVENLRIGLSGKNLLTITNYSSYDPETSTKGGTGLSTGIEVTPFPSSKQFYLHVGIDF